MHRIHNEEARVFHLWVKNKNNVMKDDLKMYNNDTDSCGKKIHSMVSMVAYSLYMILCLLFMFIYFIPINFIKIFPKSS